MQKKRNANSVLIKNKYNMIKKPTDEANTPNKFIHNKINDKSKTQLTLAFDFNDLGNSNTLQQKKSDKTILLNKLKKLKAEYQENTETKMRLTNEVNSAKNKANKQFLQNETRSDLQRGYKKLQQDLHQIQNKYKNNLKFLQEMRCELDSLRTERFQHNFSNNEPISPSSYFPEVDSISNPIIYELNQRSNDLFQKTDDLQQILDSVIKSTNKNNILEVFYEAEQIERENKEMAQYLTQYEPLLPQLMDKHKELKTKNDELQLKREKQSEKQIKQLTEISNEVSELQCHLNEIESQKTNDKIAFHDVFLEIEQIYLLLGCDINLLSTNNETISSPEKNSDSCLITNDNVMNALSIIETEVKSLVQNDPPDH